MDLSRYDEIEKYLRENRYPDGFSKQQKGILRRSCKRFQVDSESNVLYYLDKEKDGTVKKRVVVRGEEEKLRVFCERHYSNYGGHVGRDNTVSKIKDRYYWPEYYKDTIEMVSEV